MSGGMNQPDYRFYVVRPSGRILSGWSYRTDAQDGRAQEPLDVRRGSRILTRAQLAERGIDADDDRAWGLVVECDRRMYRALAAGLAGASLSEAIAYADGGDLPPCVVERVRK